ncbi:hypothetical protein ACOME3_006911 [Neoechinorhynchus agilis]
MNRVYGCEVHSLDPFSFPISVQAKFEAGEQLTVEYKPKFFFHNLGYGTAHYTSSVPNPGSMLTFKEFLRYARLERRIIDVVKMDIEGTEIDFMENVEIDYMCRHVKQLVLETHNLQHERPISMAITYRYFKALVRLHQCFRIFHRDTRFFEAPGQYSEFQVKYHKIDIGRFYTGNDLIMYVTTFGEIYMVNKNFIQ